MFSYTSDSLSFLTSAPWLVGSSFSNQGLNAGPQQRKLGVLTNGPPGNSHSFSLFFFHSFFLYFLPLSFSCENTGRPLQARKWPFTTIPEHLYPDLRLPASETVQNKYLPSNPPNLWYIVQFSRSVMSASLRPHESQHARPPCPSSSPGVPSNTRPWSQWCHPAISSSVVPFSSCPQSLPASVFSNESTLRMRWSKYWSFSFSIIPSKEIPGLISFSWTGWISLQSKGLSRVFSKTTVQKHQFFGTQLSSQSNSHIHTWPLEKP